MNPGDWVAITVEGRGEVTGILIEIPERVKLWDGRRMKSAKANGAYARVLYNDKNGQATRGVFRVGKAPQDRPMTNKRRRSRLKARLAEWRQQPCTDCGTTDPENPRTADHRIRETKAMRVREGANRSFLALEAELAKCDPVCRPCHNERERIRDSAKDRQNSVTPT